MERTDSPRVGQFSIHDDVSIKFMRRLNPDPEVLQIMEQGLRLSFTTDEQSIPPIMSLIIRVAQTTLKSQSKRFNPGKTEALL